MRELGCGSKGSARKRSAVRCRTIQITPRDAGTADVQLPDYSLGHRLVLRVQDIEGARLQSADRLARERDLRACGHVIRTAAHHGFGWPVPADETNLRCQLLPQAHGTRRERFAPDDHRLRTRGAGSPAASHRWPSASRCAGDILRRPAPGSRRSWPRSPIALPSFSRTDERRPLSTACRGWLRRIESRRRADQDSPRLRRTAHASSAHCR